MRIDFGSNASYVAMMRLPARLVERLLASPEAHIELDVSRGGGVRTLRVDGEAFDLSGVQEQGECDIVRRSAGADALGSQPQLQAVGPVKERIHVQQSLGGSGSAVRAQIKSRTEQAERAAKERHTISELSPSRASSVEPSAKRVKRTTPPPPRPMTTSATSSSMSSSSNKPTAKSAPPLRRPPPSRVSPGDSATAGAPSRSGGSGNSGPSEKDVASWCLHLLALGPRMLGDLHKVLRTAQKQQLLGGLALDTAVLKRALQQVAELKSTDRYQLRADQLPKANPSWPHYTQAQRSTLLALRARAAPPTDDGSTEEQRLDSPREAATSRADLPGQLPGPSAEAGEHADASASAGVVGHKGENARSSDKADAGRAAVSNGVGRGGLAGDVPELPIVQTEHEYTRQKAIFSEKYARYKQLDHELAASTAHFTQLEAQYREASPSQRSALAKRITSEFTKNQPEMRRKAEEYRALHLELKGIKQAVQGYVEARKSSTSA